MELFILLRHHDHQRACYPDDPKAAELPAMAAFEAEETNAYARQDEAEAVVQEAVAEESDLRFTESLLRQARLMVSIMVDAYVLIAHAEADLAEAQVRLAADLAEHPLSDPLTGCARVDTRSQRCPFLKESLSAAPNFSLNGTAPSPYGSGQCTWKGAVPPL
jgi:hypothetical protein